MTKILKKTKRKLQENVKEAREKVESVSVEEDDSETEDLLNTVDNEDDGDSSDASVESDINDEGEFNSDFDEDNDEGDSSDVEADVEEEEEEEDDDDNDESDVKESDANDTDESDADETDEEEKVSGNESDDEEEEEEEEKTTVTNGIEKSKARAIIGKKEDFKQHKMRIIPPTSDAAAAAKQQDEYELDDSSDDEDIRNTVGNIPMNWYNEYKHLGYDWDGNKILKANQGDRLDEFLKRMEDPNFWRTVKDPQTGQNVILSGEDIKLIKRIQARKIPDETYDEYAPWIEWFTSEVMKMPLRNFPEHKRSFLPSKSEARKVSKLVHDIKMGWLKAKSDYEKAKAAKKPQFYMLWSTDDQAEHMRRVERHIPPPKRALPGHAESYNPPAEYVFDERELEVWQKQRPSERKLHFVPQKYDSLRNVPSYSRYIKERFLRCLDLYLCPRAIRMRVTVQPEDLVPKLPSPRDLQPFPTVHSIVYAGHTDMVRCISTDKQGQYLVSGSDDCTIKIWEVNTGRCVKTIPVEGVVRSVEWCPNAAISLILVAANNSVLIINPHVGDYVINEKTDELLSEAPQNDLIVSERVRTTIQWEVASADAYKLGVRIVLKHFKEVTQVTWHGKGDYFATVMPNGANRSVLISQLSKRRSQLPFAKPKGLVQNVLFHPTRPLLFVATQKHVRIYDLSKQQLLKKLETNAQWISRMAIHSGGDNLLVATYDRKILWFDLDLSTKPYQTLRLHGTAVRGIAFHKRYPLFASGSDDRNLIISHGMVYNDLLQNPLIVPLKRIQDHQERDDFGIFDVQFHPLQPWVFSSGADNTIRLYSN